MHHRDQRRGITLKQPQPTTTFTVANQADNGLALYSRQFYHFQAFEALDSTRLNGNAKVNWADHWEKQVIARSYHPVLVDARTNTSYSYLALDRLADTVAHWALNSRCPERVGVYRVSPVALIAASLGLAKAGKHAVLFHDNEEPERVTKLAKRHGIKIMIGHSVEGVECHDAEAILYSTWPGPLAEVYRQRVKPDETAVVLFTGGYRGDSKPVQLSHQRLIKSMITWANRIKISPTDRCYLPIGLTHGEAFIAGLGSCIAGGATAVIPGMNVLDTDPDYWLQQVKAQECTMLQYTGQFWRSVMTERDNPENMPCPLISIFGTGLDEDLHKTLVNRFGIKRVVEYYWASDMPDVPLFNWTHRPGFCAYIPPTHNCAEDIVLVDREGKPVGPNEPGEALLKVRGKRYRRYIDSASYKNNIVTNLFSRGDRWWRSGDIMSRDAEGFFSFIKRVDEECRWQQETVCPARVEQAFNDIGWFREVVLYRVEVPFYDEPAVMASLVPFKPIYDLDLEDLLMFLQAMLPATSIPAFLRISSTPHEKTGNFKILRQPLEEKSFVRVEETDNFVLENGQYQLIDLPKLQQFDENRVHIGMEGYPEFAGIPTLLGAV